MLSTEAGSLAFWATPLPRRHDAPDLGHTPSPLLHTIDVVDQSGERRAISIPTERPLTLFVDGRELVTLMTLAAAPELLALGYLLNQQLISQVGDVRSVGVDWATQAATVTTQGSLADFSQKTAHRIVTTGCGQGTVFGDAMAQVDAIRLPPAQAARITQATLLHMLERMRTRDSVHREAGSVHGCALFHGAELLACVEDVGRHNALDTLAGWMAVHGVAGGDKLLYTTGRLTSEMVMKAAHMGVPIVVSRNGVSSLGHALAQQLGMALFGRAANRHFLCYCGFERFDADPAPHSSFVSGDWTN